MKRARITNLVRQQVESASAAPPPGFAQLQFCFFLSGAAGLVYQVAWTKSLGLLFGYTAYSTATAIAVFMAGLALGSYFIGKRSESSGAPARVYAWLELAVGLTGALSLAGLALVRGIYLQLHPFIGASKFLLLGFRVLGATLVLGIPTLLMGGTFPVLMRGVVRRSQELAQRAGRMYAVNTLGAVCGTLAAGFFLLPALGVRLSVFVAAALNLIAAVLASFSFAFYNVGAHGILARHDRWRVLVWTLTSAAVFWLVVNPPWKVVAAHYSAAQCGFLFVFSMISVLGAFSLYFLGLQHLEPTRAIIASCLEPVFSILLAAALLGEGVRSIQTLGIVLVLSAIVIVQLPGRGAADQEAVVVDPIE